MAKSKASSLLAKGLSLSVLTLFSRILGLVREMTKAHFLGTTAFSDAFGIAFMIPNLFRRLFAENSISVAFIPTFRRYIDDSETDEGMKATKEFVNATFTLVTFLTSVFVVLGMILSPWILRIFFPADEGNVISEAILLTRIMFPYLFVISVAAFFQGILNGLRIFSPSGFTPILFNIIVIASTHILTKLGLTANPARAMAIGVIAGGSIQALFQLPFVIRNGWRLSFSSIKNAFSNPGTRKVIALVGPTIIGMAGYQVNDIVSSALAARAGEGVVSSLQYSLRLQELILGICAVTVGTVILPDLTGFAKKNLWDEFNSLLSQALKIMILIAVPVTFYSLVMGENIITLVFAGGKFNRDSIALTKNVFNFHIAGLVFIALNRIIAPAFYAQQDTKSPTVAGLVNFGVNITLAIVFVKIFGGSGIALALTCASAVNTAALFVFMRSKGKIAVGSVVRSSIMYAVKMAVFSAISVVPVIFLKKIVVQFFEGHGRILSQGIPVALTAMVFGIVGVILLAATKDGILKSMLRKFKGRK